ncbi:MAG: hypothetical protein AAGA65_00205 [Actinomycetota bacterium]
MAGGRIAMFVAVAATLMLSGCSGSISFGTSPDERYLDAGEELIEGDLADQIGLGPLTANCVGTDLEAGDTFDCTGTAGGLQPIRFVGTVDADEDGVNLSSTNLLLAEQVEQVEAFSASLIAEQTSVAILPEHFECADGSVIIENGGILECLLTDPTDGTVYAAPVTVEDLETMSVLVNVGDPIG